jgi:membrane-bound metal-dependent hydrolase YbcI (DUF457 family)
MFVGHYGVSFAAKAVEPRLPLWALFLAVQLLDIAWAPLVLLGVERVGIVPGITASNPLDLYYMPYTHSLVAAGLWSLAAAAVFRLWGPAAPGVRAVLLVGLAVFSHWILDFVVHRPDLPLYDDTVKVGLGLWNRPVLALLLEAALLLGSMVLVLRGQARGRGNLLAFGFVMLGIQTAIFFGPPPASDRAAAVTALMAYAAFAVVIAWWERRYDTSTLGAA